MQRALLALILALTAIGFVPQTVEGSHDVGPDRVYFSQTGHYLSGGFLQFWRHEGGVPIFGYPITGEMEEDGTTVQYFERAVFEWHPDNPEGWRVLPRRLGAQAAAEYQDHSAFQPIEGTDSEGVLYFPETGQTLGHGFLNFWDSQGGTQVFGYPLSREFDRDGKTVQYFERAVFEFHPDNPEGWRVQLQRLGAQAAQEAGVDTSPVGHDPDVPQYDPSLWTIPEPEPTEPAPVAGIPAGAPTGQAKWIEVDLTNQTLRAWEYDEPVFSAVVSTGEPDTPTIAGTFQTFSHLRYDDMTGGRAGTADYYNLPDVPYVMYYQAGGYAIHGTYWHNNFGTPMSHGCVNMTIPDARWLYNWTPYGTTVFIHGTTPGA